MSASSQHQRDSRSVLGVVWRATALPRCWVFLALLACAGLATPGGVSRAAVRQIPVEAHLRGPVREAVAGQPITVEVEISAARAADLGDLTIGGDGWQITRWDGPARVDLAAGASVEWTLTATPAPGFGRLVLSGLLDGRPWQQAFDLDPESSAGRQPSDSSEPPPGRLLQATSRAGIAERELPMEAMRAALVPGVARTGTPAGLQKDVRTPVTITGSIVYWHDGAGRDIPAFGAKVIAFYRPSGVPFWFSSSDVYTEEDGSFSTEIPIPCDFYIKIEASNRAAVVEDASWEADWVWSTGVMEVPSGATEFDAGWIAPTSHQGALHIMSDLTYLHDLLRDAGYDVGSVDVQWPDDGEETSYYSDYFDEIHLQRADAWDDWVACHEWGHYWNDMHAHFPSFDYCNGICDGDDCSHCVWCPETSATSWIEGLANLVSRIGTDRIDQSASWPVVTLDIQNVPDDKYGSLDPDCPWDPWNTEGVWAAAAYDLYDSGDTGTEHDLPIYDAAGERLVDRVHIPLEDLLSLLADHCDVEGHEPYRPTGFFRCALAYCDSYGSPATIRKWMWQTAGNCGIDIDEYAPSAVPGLTGSVPTGVPTQISQIRFDWGQPADDASGVCGYSYALRSYAGFHPDHVIDTSDRWHSMEIEAGTWYFSVVAVDRAGRWSAAPAVYGPIIILAPGPAELAPETPSGWTAPLVLRSAPVDAPNPVLQSSILPAHTTYLNYGGRNSGTGPTGAFNDRIYVDGVGVWTSNQRNMEAGSAYSERNLGPYDLNLTGRHTCWAYLDHASTVAEPNEANNWHARQFVFVPEPMDPAETITDEQGAPDPTAGQALVQGGPFYPNCDGYRAPIAIYPDLFWAVSLDDEKRHVLRMHSSTYDQTGFTTPWVETSTSPALPAAIFQNPSETLVTSYCVGVSGSDAASGGYRICRELGTIMALPDTIQRNLPTNDCLDFYIAYNELEDDGWFTIKLVNAGITPLQLRFFEPGFTQGSLADADAVMTAAPADTVVHHVFLEHGRMAMAVITRDPRAVSGSIYQISAYHRKPDFEAYTPANWAGNVVPAVGTPHDPQGPVPAPASLIGGADTTGVYYALRNLSDAAGAPAGLRYEVALDGSYLFGSIFIDPLPPGHELRLAHGALHAIRGGRHTLTHRINPAQSIDEDDFTNNFAGQQWVWSPAVLAANQVSDQPPPPPAQGGWSYVTSGTRYDNCDGFQCTSVGTSFRILAAYVADDVMDVNVGFYQGAGVQDGFTTAHAISATSGAGCDFVLRYLVPHVPGLSYIGVTRGAGLATGDYSLCTRVSTDSWTGPVGDDLRGNVAVGEQLDLVRTTLPPGRYELTLHSVDVALGFSLHDLSAQYSGKADPFDQGIALQPDGNLADVSFTVTVPSPAPATLAIAVWRPDGSTLSTRADWSVAVSEDLSASAGGEVAAALDRVVGVAPNPFSPHAAITFDRTEPGRVELTIHDVSGRLFRTLVDATLPAGRRTATWDGRDDGGRRVPAGVYVARLRVAGREIDRRKLTLLR